MSLILALLPVSVSCVLILVWRHSAGRAAGAGVLTALVVALLWPAFSITVERGLPAVIETLSYSMNIGFVLLGGVLLYQALRAGGGLEVIANWVQSCVADEMHCLLVVVFGVGVFFESATGFGVGILVTAPLLLALGYSPMNAAFLALLGQCAVSWGALAIGTSVGADLSGVPARVLGLYAVPLSAPFLLLCGLAAVTAGGLWQQRSAGSLLIWIVAYSSVLSALLWSSTYLFGIELPGCLAGAGVVAFGFLVSRRSSSTQPQPVPWRALLPFVLLVVGLMTSRLAEPVKQWLLSVSIGGFAPFYHAGFWLILAMLLAVALLPRCRRTATGWLRTGVVQWCSAIIAVSGFLLLGQLMKYTGMTAVLAESASAASGQHYALFASALGALGGFLTASNASSNALFMEFQVKTAVTVGMPVDLAASVQSTAGSNTTLASPGRVVFAASIVGGGSAEAALLRRVIPVAVGGALGTALLTFFLWRSFT